MMEKKLYYLFFGLLTFLLVVLDIIHAVNGDLTTNLTEHWDWDTDYTGSKGSYDGVGNGSTINTTFGKIGGSAYLDGSSRNSVNIYTIPLGNIFTINCWVYTTDDEFYMWSRTTGGAMAKGSQTIINMDGNHQIFIANGASQTPYGPNPWFIPRSRFFMITYFINTDIDTIEMSIDANANYSTSSASAAYTDDPIYPLRFGSRTDGGGFSSLGYLDECAIWSRNLTQAEKSSLYNNGNGLPYSSWTAPIISIALDKNFTGVSSIWSNVSCSGTSCATAEYHLYDLDSGLVYNGSNFFNYTGLTNNTFYRLRWNASIVGAKTYLDFNITTLQTAQATTDYCLESYNNSEEVIEMLSLLPIVILYIFFMWFSYYLMVHWNLMSGYALAILTFAMDFYLVGYFYEHYISVLEGSDIWTRLYGLFGIGVLVWIALKLIFYLSLRVTRKAIV